MKPNGEKTVGRKGYGQGRTMPAEAEGSCMEEGGHTHFHETLHKSNCKDETGELA